MRVAFAHDDPDHPNAGVAAYRYGRIIDTPHPLTGETLRADDIAVALLEQAREEYPESAGYHVWLERLSDADEDGEGRWEPIDEDALRARASGDPVEVGVLDEAEWPGVIRRSVEAQQESKARAAVSGEEE